jgi:hypothetical protein
MLQEQENGTVKTVVREMNEDVFFLYFLEKSVTIVFLNLAEPWMMNGNMRRIPQFISSKRFRPMTSSLAHRRYTLVA